MTMINEWRETNAVGHCSDSDKQAGNGYPDLIWKQLLSPSSIAFLGVSSRPGVFQVGGRAALDHVVRHGFKGGIYPVSRTAAEIGGYKTYGSITELPVVPDCVVIALPAPAVNAAVREAIAHGSRAFVLISAGFAESGDAGVALQQELRSILKEAGAIAIGPNTTGFMNFRAETVLTSTSRAAGSLCAPGRIGLVLQSGALGSTTLDLAANRDIGLSYLISTGNEVVTDISDCIRFLVADPATDVIALYLEGFRNPEGFVSACQLAADRGKAIVALKSGKSEAGSQAVAGHTGALAGSAHVQRALFRQLGIVSVNSLQELLSVSALLASGKKFGPRLGVFTASGGLGGLLVDSFEGETSITFPTGTAGTVTAMQEDFPELTRCANPLDFGGWPFGGAAFRKPGTVAKMLKAFARDPNIDGVVVGVTPVVPDWADEIARAAIEVHDESEKPVAVAWISADANAGHRRMLRQAGVAVFEDVRECAASLGAAIARQPCRYSHRVRRRSNGSSTAMSVLNEHQSKAVLLRRGLAAFPEERFVASHDERALRVAAREVGYPVTIKGLMRGTAHKSELGLVSVGIGSEEEMLVAARRQAQSIVATGGEFEGFILVETVKPRAEILASVITDEHFGPVLTVGAGGVYTEILRDVSSRVLPVSASEISEMIDECKIAQVLHGARGGSPLDIPAIVEFLTKLSDIAVSGEDEIVAVEINPLAVFSEGSGVAVLDAKVFVAGGGENAA